LRSRLKKDKKKWGKGIGTFDFNSGIYRLTKGNGGKGEGMGTKVINFREETMKLHLRDVK